MLQRGEGTRLADLTPRTPPCIPDYLGQLPQLRPHPAQLLQHTVVKGCLLLPAMAKLQQVRVVNAGPVLSEGICAVQLDLPTNSKNRHQSHQSGAGGAWRGRGFPLPRKHTLL